MTRNLDESPNIGENALRDKSRDRFRLDLMTLNLFLLLTQHSLFWMADIELNADVFLVSDSEHSINATTSVNIELTPDAFALSEDEYPIVTTTSADIELNDNVLVLYPFIIKSTPFCFHLPIKLHKMY
jgi:hypothetical protein